MDRDRKRRSGITLIELMAAVALLGVLALVGARLVISSTRFWNQEQAQIERGQSARLALTRVADLLAAQPQAIPGVPGPRLPADFNSPFGFFAVTAPGEVSANCLFTLGEEQRAAELWWLQSDADATLAALPENQALETVQEALARSEGDPRVKLEEAGAVRLLWAVQLLRVESSGESFWLRLMVTRDAEAEVQEEASSLDSNHFLQQVHPLRVPFEVAIP